MMNSSDLPAALLTAVADLDESSQRVLPATVTRSCSHLNVTPCCIT